MEVEPGVDPAATKRWAAAQELAAGVRDEHYTRRRTKLWVLILLLLIGVGGLDFSSALRSLGVRAQGSPSYEPGAQSSFWAARSSGWSSFSSMLFGPRPTFPGGKPSSRH